MNLRRSVLAVLACGAVVAGCGGDDTAPAGSVPAVTTDTTSTAAPPTSTAPQPGAEPELTACLTSGQPTPDPKPTFQGAEDVLKGAASATIVMKTSCGTLNITLDPAAGGPIPNSIAFLTSKGFYDGLTFHRVVPDFVLQGGDPAGNGSGGPGYEVVGPVPAGYTYKLGDVAMAKTSAAPAGSSGSQFFVVSGPQGESVLTAQPVYGILGHANDPVSLATIKRIAALAVTDGPPSTPVWIISATLQTSADR